MSVEIEAKLKVDSLAEVEQKLPELGAEFVAEQLQTDIFLDDGEDTLIANDRCLRIRRQVIGQSERCFLCYKGGRQESEFKKRQEIETEIKDFRSMLKLLSALGYEEKLDVEKKRRLWRLGGCEVALDELPLLGNFVEIEGPDVKRIADVQASLGLVALPAIAESYAQMIMKKHGRDTD
ncbi:MAG: class IV adenylate cyclase [Phycisphaerales bacterium]|nr:MAG: class IV adenylate cyclase [Phycisphaerales bacterium]